KARIRPRRKRIQPLSHPPQSLNRGPGSVWCVTSRPLVQALSPGLDNLAASEFREESTGALPVLTVRVSVQADQIFLLGLRIPDGRQGEQERKHDDVLREEKEAHGSEEERQIDRMPNVTIRSALKEGPFLGELTVHVLPGQICACREQGYP